ncbi:MAG: hypothetical protein AAGJ35_03955, partial [Myxococcota bacterium]
MKKWSFALCFACLLALPALGHAEVKYINITIKQIKLWPVKPTGHCWDPPCFGKKYNLPPRGAKNYQDYFKDKNFRTVCKGSPAPDAL